MAGARHSPRRERPHHGKADLAKARVPLLRRSHDDHTVGSTGRRRPSSRVFTVLDVYGPVQAFASCRVVQPDGSGVRSSRSSRWPPRAGRVKAGEGAGELGRVELREAPDYDILLIPRGFGTARRSPTSRVRRASRRGEPAARVTTRRRPVKRPSPDALTSPGVEQRLDCDSRRRACSGSARPAGSSDGNIVTLGPAFSAGSTWRWRLIAACHGREDGA